MAIGTPTANGTVASNGTAVNLSVTNTTPSGASLFLGIETLGIGTISVTDARGNTWTVDAQPTWFFGSNNFAVARCLSPGTQLTAGDNITISVTGGAVDITAAHMYCTGIVAALDGSVVSATGSADPTNSGNLATSNASDLLVGVTVSSNPVALTPINSFTDVGQLNNAGAAKRLIFMARVVSATGTYSSGATGGGGNQYGSLIAAYKGPLSPTGKSLNMINQSINRSGSF